MGKLRLEVYPWLTNTLGAESLNPIILEEEIAEGETVKDLLNRMAPRYPRFVEAIFNTKTQQLTGVVSLFYNGRMLELLGGVETRLSPETTLTLMPPWEGGQRRE